MSDKPLGAIYSAIYGAIFGIIVGLVYGAWMFSAALTIFGAIVGAVVGLIVGAVAWATTWHVIKFLLGGIYGAVIATLLGFGLSLYARRFLGPAEIYIGVLVMAIIGLIGGAIIGLRKVWAWEEVGT